MFVLHKDGIGLKNRWANFLALYANNRKKMFEKQFAALQFIIKPWNDFLFSSKEREEYLKGKK